MTKKMTKEDIEAETEKSTRRRRRTSIEMLKFIRKNRRDLPSGSKSRIFRMVREKSKKKK
jgi:hypothetical protein